MFPRAIVCLRNISINTLPKGDDDDDDDEDDDNKNNLFYESHSISDVAAITTFSAVHNPHMNLQFYIYLLSPKFSLSVT